MRFWDFQSHQIKKITCISINHQSHSSNITITTMKMYLSMKTATLLLLGITTYLLDSHQCNAFQSPLPYNRSWVRRIDGTTRTTLQQASKRSGAISRKKNKKKNTNSNTGGSGSSSGFGKTRTKSVVGKEAIAMPSGAIYSRPALYDLAFGYRNYEEEVDFLLSAHEKYSIGYDLDGAAAGSSGLDSGSGSDSGRHIIELAAGPARHSITCLRNNPNSVSSCTAVDISADMMNYSNEIADEELGDGGYGGIRDRFHYIHADMRTLGTSSENESETDTDTDHSSSGLKLNRNSYDSAWILLGSMQHLTTNADVISCFQSAYNILRPGGTMVIELPHPRETFTMVECTRNGWEVPLEDEDGNEYGELKIIWGDDDDKFDPIRQVRDFTVAMDLTVHQEEEMAAMDSSDLQSVKEVVPMRLFTFQEIDALSHIAGFEVADLYGALSDEIDVNSEDMAFRLVCVLRKTN